MPRPVELLPSQQSASSPQPRRPRRAFLLLGVVLATGLGIGLFSGVGSNGSRTATVGGPAPAFSLPRLAGPGNVGTPADGGGGGRPAVLLFFASWCTPCQQEIPALAAAYRAQGRGSSAVPVIGVDVLDPRSQAKAFVDRSGVTFPVAVDATGRVTEGLYAFIGPPAAVFISRDGTIVHIARGSITPRQLLSWEARLR